MLPDPLDVERLRARLLAHPHSSSRSSPTAGAAGHAADTPASHSCHTTGKTGAILGDAGPAICPTGSVLTGGGGIASTAGGAAPSAIAYSGPAFADTGDPIPEGWMVIPVNATDEALSFARVSR